MPTKERRMSGEVIFKAQSQSLRVAYELVDDAKKRRKELEKKWRELKGPDKSPCYCFSIRIVTALGRDIYNVFHLKVKGKESSVKWTNFDPHFPIVYDYLDKADALQAAQTWPLVCRAWHTATGSQQFYAKQLQRFSPECFSKIQNIGLPYEAWKLMCHEYIRYEILNRDIEQKETEKMEDKGVLAAIALPALGAGAGSGFKFYVAP
jgi:hypothetical protein